MQVREILDQKSGVCSISLAESVYAAAKMMTEENIGILVVLSHKRLVGVISERDIVTKVISRDLDPTRVSVGEVMSTNLVVASPDESLESCEDKMRKAHCRHILILDGQKLVAVISLRDIFDFSGHTKTDQITVEEKIIWKTLKDVVEAVPHS